MFFFRLQNGHNSYVDIMSLVIICHYYLFDHAGV